MTNIRREKAHFWLSGWLTNHVDRLTCFSPPSVKSFFRLPSSNITAPDHKSISSLVLTHPPKIRKHAQEVRGLILQTSWSFKRLPLYADLRTSGIARTLGRSALAARPQLPRRAFQPFPKQLAASLSARFASSDSAKEGRVHQVIGAVVDGTSSPLAES